MNDLKYMGRNRCSITDPGNETFVSLVDYRNTLFLSNDQDKLSDFYNSFENTDQLVRWMKERPKGANYIREEEGNKEVIVVIPTSDFDGLHARDCRYNIYKGLHMIFVESGEIPDLYFNYAHNCNIGIRKAAEYKPKWIVVSNDDKIKFMEPTVLLQELSNLDPKKIGVVIPRNHEISYLCRKNSLFETINHVSSYFSRRAKLEKRFGVKYKLYAKEKRTIGKILGKITLKRLLKTEIPGSFFIISADVCNTFGKEIFDETYQNGMEDVDLFIRFHEHSLNVSFIDYHILDKGGSSLGKEKIRYSLRGILNRSYFNLKNHGLLAKLEGSKMVEYAVEQDSETPREEK